MTAGACSRGYQNHGWRNIAITLKTLSKELWAELLGTAIERQFGAQRIRTGVNHPEISSEI